MFYLSYVIEFLFFAVEKSVELFRVKAQIKIEVGMMMTKLREEKKHE